MSGWAAQADAFTTGLEALNGHRRGGIGWRFFCLRTLLLTVAATAVCWPVTSHVLYPRVRLATAGSQLRRSRTRRRHAWAPGSGRELVVAADRLVQPAVPIVSRLRAAACSAGSRRVRRTSDATKAGTSACARPNLARVHHRHHQTPTLREDSLLLFPDEPCVSSFSAFLCPLPCHPELVPAVLVPHYRCGVLSESNALLHPTA